jgi:hypothetical protein
LGGASSLDSILERNKAPRDFDFLSIDIDGCDYQILESLNRYRPKLICIEYNPTIPNAVDFVQPKDFKVKVGSSARAIYRLALEKRYTPVASTFTNLFLLADEYCEAVGEDADLAPLEEIRDDQHAINYFFSGYDGTVFLSQGCNLPWHNLSVTEKKFQLLPKLLRVFPADFGLIRKFLFAAYVAVFHSSQVSKYLANLKKS